MRIVVALGGNALLKRGEVLSAENQRRNMRDAAGALADIARMHELVLVHGNGPQVGLLALEAEAYEQAPAYPLDVLGAESQGMIGYIVAQELGNALRESGPDNAPVTLITQSLVDADDPAFAAPTKPIGPVYGKDEAERLTRERGWTVAPDGDGFRRVVASPDPKGIVEIETVRTLIDAGRTVICAGGGGVPVVEGRHGRAGIEAVIDKDLAAALVARAIGAEALVILTDVDGVYENWGTPQQRRIGEGSVASLRALPLPPGSMGPKVEAVCRFIEAGGRFAAIGALSEAAQVAASEVGTLVRG